MGSNSTFLGSVAGFDPDQESISSYIERVKLFFVANDVKEEKQVAVFLSVVGASTYGLLRTLLTPDKPSEKSLADLTSALVAHYEPKPMVITQRFHFHRRNQDPTESITEYVAALRKLSTFCDFGDQLDNALHDRLVCGVHSEALQKVLLSTKDLTFKAAMEKALSMEAADHNTKELHAKGPLPVNKVAKPLPTPRVSALSKTTQPSQSRAPHHRPHQRAHQYLDLIVNPATVVGRIITKHISAVILSPSVIHVARKATLLQFVVLDRDLRPGLTQLTYPQKRNCLRLRNYTFFV